MSIYGPPRRELRSVRRQRARVRNTRLVIAGIVLASLAAVAFIAYSDLSDDFHAPGGSTGPRFQFYPVPPPPIFLPPSTFELPEPLQFAEILPPNAHTPAVQTSATSLAPSRPPEPASAPQIAEPAPEPAPEEPLFPTFQVAEPILR